MANSPVRKLALSFHGRIIDQLGIQMYQSPVAAIAEIVSNSWDADAEHVEVELPSTLGENAEIVLSDDGVGMTFDECEQRYLNVGWCRREGGHNRSPGKDRPVLGRKGIGKFAGFGIAEEMQVETTSKRTGERTVFTLDIARLRAGGYVATSGLEIEPDDYLAPDAERAAEHGTTIRLRRLTVGKRSSPEAFARSMARRFLLRQRTGDFVVRINGLALPEDADIVKAEYVFPRDYRKGEMPDGLIPDGAWGSERLSNGKLVKWRFCFLKDPIEDEELRGIAVYCRGKIAQQPFTFNITGGLGGQHGLEYLTGQVVADYIDDLSDDVIATERQRINWEHSATAPLREWGEARVKRLCALWRDRRGEARRNEIEGKVSAFSSRLDRLPKHEQRTVKSALTKLGGIETLTDVQFRSLAEALLLAWEQGRLKGLIDDPATQTDVTSEWLLSTLAEAEVIVALNLAEAVRAKLEAVRGLRALVTKGELENKVRDYIADRPWLLHPRWETFRKETAVQGVLSRAAHTAGLPADTGVPSTRQRIDLALRSGDHLLIVEFMKPGLTADWDHVSRCRRYLNLIRSDIGSQSALGIRTITGLMVADNLDKDPSVKVEVAELAKSDILAYTWDSLMQEADKAWREYLAILGERAPGDRRLQAMQPTSPSV